MPVGHCTGPVVGRRHCGGARALRIPCGRPAFRVDGDGYFGLACGARPRAGGHSASGRGGRQPVFAVGADRRPPSLLPSPAQRGGGVYAALPARRGVGRGVPCRGALPLLDGTCAALCRRGVAGMLQHAGRRRGVGTAASGSGTACFRAGLRLPASPGRAEDQRVRRVGLHRLPGKPDGAL